MYNIQSVDSPEVVIDSDFIWKGTIMSSIAHTTKALNCGIPYLDLQLLVIPFLTLSNI